MIEFRIVEKRYANGKVEFIPQKKGYFDTPRLFKDLNLYDYHRFSNISGSYPTRREASKSIDEYVIENIPTEIKIHKIENKFEKEFEYPKDDDIYEILNDKIHTNKIKKNNKLKYEKR